MPKTEQLSLGTLYCLNIIQNFVPSAMATFIIRKMLQNTTKESTFKKKFRNLPPKYA